MKIKNVGHWVRDYFYLAHGLGHSFVFRKPPKHYLGHIVHGKAPIIIIPGVFSKWNFFLWKITNPLSLKGHPVYVPERLGYNTKEISHSARLVKELIDEKNLKNVIIIAHSKGGLIGKYILAFFNKDNRVKGLIAVATPFHGSRATKLLPLKSIKELSPESSVIQELQKKTSVNEKIISIFPIFDNHIWPTSSSYLEGAENIQIEIHGHHKIIFDKKVAELISKKVEEI